MITTLGWIGAIAFTLCAVPQAIQCWRQKHGEGISVLFLCVWLVGEVCMLIAIPCKYGWVWWLMMNYIGNTLSLLVIMRYRFWPKKDWSKKEELIQLCKEALSVWGACTGKTARKRFEIERRLRDAVREGLPQ